MKKCPFCAEEIQDAAIVCRYCGRGLENANINVEPSNVTVLENPPISQVHSKDNCQSCGLPNETKYVEFQQNIGMIIMRNYRNVKGNFCKSCIDYYFWNFTGKTMLLGWWGIISFIVTPFILLNNILRFIFTMGMKKPPLSITPNPSPLWVFTVIGGFLLTCFFCFSIFFSMFLSADERSTYSPPAIVAPSIAPISTHIPTKIKKTPTAQTSDCIQWSKVTTAMIGSKACVYGIVYKTKSVGTSTTQILFSNNQESFFLAGGTYYYDVGQGDCVLAEGKILKSGAGVPYIDIDEALYKCESWMK